MWSVNAVWGLWLRRSKACIWIVISLSSGVFLGEKNRFKNPNKIWRTCVWNAASTTADQILISSYIDLILSWINFIIFQNSVVRINDSSKLLIKKCKKKKKKNWVNNCVYMDDFSSIWFKSLWLEIPTFYIDLKNKILCACHWRYILIKCLGQSGSTCCEI